MEKLVPLLHSAKVFFPKRYSKLLDYDINIINVLICLWQGLIAIRFQLLGRENDIRNDMILFNINAIFFQLQFHIISNHFDATFFKTLTWVHDEQGMRI